MSLASLVIYINEDEKADYFIDECASFQEGKFSLILKILALLSFY